MEWDGTASDIGQQVIEHLRGLGRLDGLRVVDVPACPGHTSRVLRDAGAEVLPLDLFPEALRVEGLEARYADLGGRLPVADGWADLVVFQEGIEHVPDQLHALEEINRILAPGGRLLLTTPNLSNLRSRLSWFLMESDMWRRMPPTEVDSVWFAEGGSERLYFGHLFLLGVHRLQALLRIAGFESVERLRTKVSPTSAALTVLLWPLLALLSWKAYLRYPRKTPHGGQQAARAVFREHRVLNLAFTTNACKSIFWVQRKVRDAAEARARLRALTRTGADAAQA